MTHRKEKRCDIFTVFSSHLLKMISVLIARYDVPDTVLSISFLCDWLFSYPLYIFSVPS